METTVRSKTREVIISPDRPTVLIGERINPTGKKALAAALQAGDMELVRREAIEQVAAGADVLDVNVGAAGVDEAQMLPLAVRTVMEVVDVPLCLDSDKPEAITAALEVCEGKAIVNSVNGQEHKLATILPLVARYGAAVIGLCMDDRGIPPDAATRIEIARRIIARAEAAGIPRNNVLIDCLTLTISTDTNGALATLNAMRAIRDEFGVNLTLGASNVSYGLPDRPVINNAFLALAIQSGLTCPLVDVARVRPTVLAVDLLLGRDPNARRYLRDFRARNKPQA